MSIKEIAFKARLKTLNNSDDYQLHINHFLNEMHYT